LRLWQVLQYRTELSVVLPLLQSADSAPEEQGELVHCVVPLHQDPHVFLAFVQDFLETLADIAESDAQLLCQKVISSKAKSSA